MFVPMFAGNFIYDIYMLWKMAHLVRLCSHLLLKMLIFHTYIARGYESSLRAKSL